MTMSTADIREHADRLQGRLESERKKVDHGDYRGDPAASHRLINALQGRITELLVQCDVLDAAQAEAAVLVTV